MQHRRLNDVTAVFVTHSRVVCRRLEGNFVNTDCVMRSRSQCRVRTGDMFVCLYIVLYCTVFSLSCRATIHVCFTILVIVMTLPAISLPRHAVFGLSVRVHACVIIY